MEPLKPITVRASNELGHISMAVQTMNGMPFKLWSLYEHAGQIHLATCDDVDVLPTNWKIIDTLDIDASEAAIVFDGVWKWHTELQAWRLYTEETPWVFWVNSYKVLKAQKYGSEEITDLAYDVTGLSALRGWKNPVYPDQDHGLIVSYIQYGGLFYRNYATQTTGETIWEPESEILYPTDTLIKSAQLFLLNDYRTGVVIEDVEGMIHWAITPRNWAGMAVRPETVTAAPVNTTVTLIPIEYVVGYVEDVVIKAVPNEIMVDLRYASTDNMFVEVYNQPIVIEGVTDWGKELIVRTQHELYNINYADFEIVDSYNRTYYPDTATKIDDRLYKLEFLDLNNFNNVGSTGTIKFRGLYTTNGIGLIYAPFESVFYPQNLVPTEIPLPEVEAIWNE